jgi:hypothetical protein
MHVMPSKPKDAMPGQTETGFRGRVRNAILGLMAAYKRMMKPWDSAKLLFNYREIDGALEKAIPDADMRLAVEVFILAGLITFIMSVVAIVGSAYIANAESATIQDAIGVAQPRLEPIALAAPIVLSFIIYMPVSILLALALEYCAFRILRMIGGKATFAQQLYLSSLVALATAFASGFYIFFPIPCLQLFGAICLIIVNTYLALIVAGRAYSIAHRIGPIPGFMTTLMMALIKLVAIFLIINSVAPLLGLPQQMTMITDALKGA